MCHLTWFSTNIKFHLHIFHDIYLWINIFYFMRSNFNSSSQDLDANNQARSFFTFRSYEWKDSIFWSWKEILHVFCYNCYACFLVVMSSESFHSLRSEFVLSIYGTWDPGIEVATVMSQFVCYSRVKGGHVA